MKTTVKIGKWFSRIETGSDDPAVKAAVARHVEACGECQRMMKERREKKRG